MKNHRKYNKPHKTPYIPRGVSGSLKTDPLAIWRYYCGKKRNTRSVRKRRREYVVKIEKGIKFVDRPGIQETSTW